MHQQPPEYIGNLFAIVFCVGIAFYAVKAYLENKPIDLSNLDLLTLGYIEDSPIIVQNIQKNNFESQQLYTDCIDALHALGMKKSEAKRRAKIIFSTYDNPPKSVQEFLIIALKQ